MSIRLIDSKYTTITQVGPNLFKYQNSKINVDFYSDGTLVNKETNKKLNKTSSKQYFISFLPKRPCSNGIQVTANSLFNALIGRNHKRGYSTIFIDENKGYTKDNTLSIHHTTKQLIDEFSKYKNFVISLYNLNVNEFSESIDLLRNYGFKLENGTEIIVNLIKEGSKDYNRGFLENINGTLTYKRAYIGSSKLDPKHISYAINKLSNQQQAISHVEVSQPSNDLINKTIIGFTPIKLVNCSIETLESKIQYSSFDNVIFDNEESVKQHVFKASIALKLAKVIIDEIDDIKKAEEVFCQYMEYSNGKPYMNFIKLMNGLPTYISKSLNQYKINCDSQYISKSLLENIYTDKNSVESVAIEIDSIIKSYDTIDFINLIEI